MAASLISEAVVIARGHDVQRRHDGFDWTTLQSAPLATGGRGEIDLGSFCGVCGLCAVIHASSTLCANVEHPKTYITQREWCVSRRWHDMVWRARAARARRGTERDREGVHGTGGTKTGLYTEDGARHAGHGDVARARHGRATSVAVQIAWSGGLRSGAQSEASSRA